MEHPKSRNQKCEQINEKKFFLIIIGVYVNGQTKTMCPVTNNVTTHLALESTVPLTRSGVNRT